MHIGIVALQHHLRVVIVQMAGALSHEKASFVASRVQARTPTDCTCSKTGRRRIIMSQQPKLVVFALFKLNSRVIREHADVGEEACNAIVAWRLHQVLSFVEGKAKRPKVVLKKGCNNLGRKMNAALFSKRNILGLNKHATVYTMPEVGMLPWNVGLKARGSLFFGTNPAVVVCDSCNESPASTVRCHVTVGAINASRPVQVDLGSEPIEAISSTLAAGHNLPTRLCGVFSVPKPNNRHHRYLK